MTNVYNPPSAWRHLEKRYREHLRGLDPRVIVEIGVDYGFSLFHIAEDFPLALVVGIDWYGANALHNDAREWVETHLPEFRNVHLIVNDSREEAKKWKLSIDLLHIDAIHDYENLRTDFELWSPFVRPGGIVMFHDVTTFPDMRRYFDEIPGEKFVIPEHNGLGFWYKPEGK